MRPCGLKLRGQLKASIVSFKSYTVNACNQEILVVYPMLTANRQAEVNMEWVDELKKDYKTFTDVRIEASGVLEGTGSLVVDWDGKQVFAAISPSTEEEMVLNWSKRFGLKPILFHSFHESGNAIYHRVDR